MQIINKKTSHEYIVTNTEWQQIVDLGYGKCYVVIDRSNVTEKRVLIPSKIVEFQINAPKKILPTKPIKKAKKKL